MARRKLAVPKRAVVSSIDEQVQDDNATKPSAASKEEEEVTEAMLRGRPSIRVMELMIVIMLVSILGLPSMETLDEVATVHTFTTMAGVTTTTTISDKDDDESRRSVAVSLAYGRLLIALAMASVSIHMACFSNGWIQRTNYLKSISKLKSCDIVMQGYKTLLPFTSVSWNLLTLSFALNAYIGYQSQVALDDSNVIVVVSPVLLRTALLVWETAAPCTLLVSAVIRYAIWPNILRQGGSTANIQHVRMLIMHNVNSILALTELAFTNQTLRFSEMALAPLYGCAYVFLTWSLVNTWAPKENGPQFIYFFFDTTLGTKRNMMALLGLLAVLLTSYCCMTIAAYVLSSSLDSSSGSSTFWRLVFVVGMSSLVCRFRD